MSRLWSFRLHKLTTRVPSQPTAPPPAGGQQPHGQRCLPEPASSTACRAPNAAHKLGPCRASCAVHSAGASRPAGARTRMCHRPLSRASFRWSARRPPRCPVASLSQRSAPAAATRAASSAARAQPSAGGPARAGSSATAQTRAAPRRWQWWAGVTSQPLQQASLTPVGWRLVARPGAGEACWPPPGSARALGTCTGGRCRRTAVWHGATSRAFWARLTVLCVPPAFRRPRRGAGDVGQLGDGRNSSGHASWEPVPVAGGHRFVALDAGDSHGAELHAAGGCSLAGA